MDEGAEGDGAPQPHGGADGGGAHQDLDTDPAQHHGGNSSNGHAKNEQRRTMPATAISLAPRLAKTPTPTPTVFEWRSDIQRKLVSIDNDVEALKQGGGVTTRMSAHASSSILMGGGSVADQKTFKLSKEFEDEETAFQRTTTKIALDVARAEAAKGIQKAKTVENACAKLQERVDAMQQDYEARFHAQTRLQAELQSRVSQAEADKQAMRKLIEELQEDSRAKDKRCNDLEDVVFFLQDEIAKLQQAAADAAAKKAAGPAGRGRAPAPSPPKAPPGKAPAPVKKKK